MSLHEPLLSIEALHVHIRTAAGIVQPVRGIDLQLEAGETLAIVGESGCGKSMTALAVMGLLPVGGSVAAGAVRLSGYRLDNLTESGWREVRGRRIGMVFQNPMSAFNPTMRIGEQIAESLVHHRHLDWDHAHRRAVALLDRMRIPDAATRVQQYPFQFSGGMLQRAMIAMALACGPELLIADEPTTALDVSVQVGLLELLRELQTETGLAILLITHDLAIVAEIAQRVAVMYAGQIVEQAPVDALFAQPAHPYTAGLLQSLPERHEGAGPLSAIAGTPPDLLQPPAGCAFYDRCPAALRLCATAAVPRVEISATQRALCWLRHPAVVGSGAVPPLAEQQGSES
ncbi:MAG: ABC transporter ATP-binding protein [Spongiibacteraceae bacterium]|jgi:oligopeptide/dipeptide ABC transporter ATP-binding protein|nr:ABC transporter ATP-binding protein [Spongiibacteraceae bacterium]